jgi:hypothetical protein
LRSTLIILALAIIGLVFASVLDAWVLTALIVRLFIILAGYRLWRDTAAVVREAARFTHILITLAVLLTLASPALARPEAAASPAPVRCTTYEEKTLNRYHTLCADGTRGISTYNRTLQRWETTITTPAGKACTGTMNPRTQQVEVRCR